MGQGTRPHANKGVYTSSSALPPATAPPQFPSLLPFSSLCASAPLSSSLVVDYCTVKGSFTSSAFPLTSSFTESTIS